MEAFPCGPVLCLDAVLLTCLFLLCFGTHVTRSIRDREEMVISCRRLQEPAAQPTLLPPKMLLQPQEQPQEQHLQARVGSQASLTPCPFAGQSSGTWSEARL